MRTIILTVAGSIVTIVVALLLHGVIREHGASLGSSEPFRRIPEVSIAVLLVIVIAGVSVVVFQTDRFANSPEEATVTVTLTSTPAFTSTPPPTSSHTVIPSPTATQTPTPINTPVPDGLGSRVRVLDYAGLFHDLNGELTPVLALSPEQEVTILGRSDERYHPGWLYVETDIGKRGYVNSSLLDWHPADPQVLATIPTIPVPPTHTAIPGRVGMEIPVMPLTGIYRTPQGSSERLMILSPPEKVTILGKADPYYYPFWLYVRYNEVEGFVARDRTEWLVEDEDWEEAWDRLPIVSP